jgi:pilus assembly protein CpaB
VITGVFYQITAGRNQTRVAAEKKLLVVAKADMPIGSMITAEDLRVVEYPVEAYPQGGFEDIELVVDRSVMQPILQNEPVTAARLTEKGAGFGLAPLIPEGYRAIAIAVNQVSGVSGFILPGSKVDVLISGTPDGRSEAATTTVLENVTVLSTGHKQQADANGQPENVPVVNMLLKPEDAELLTLATSEWRIQLVLRNPKDEEETASERDIRTSSELFARLAPRKPAPTARAPRPAPLPVVVEPPPPAIFQIEMIRGAERSVQDIERGESN